MKNETSLSLFSRNNPSPRYHELLKHYKDMHENGEVPRAIAPGETFAGGPREKQIFRIRNLLARYGSKSLLDYGAGKGLQYGPIKIEIGDDLVFHSMSEFYGVENIKCYDPGFEPFSGLPKGRFDGVICLDVLEHCPQEDMHWIVEEIFSYSNHFVYANIASFPAFAHLPSGENAHCTIQGRAWWEDLISEVAARYSSVCYHIVIETKDDVFGEMECLIEG